MRRALALSRERERIHREADHPREFPCYCGHVGCATAEGGACIDELLTTHEVADPSCPECER